MHSRHELAAMEGELSFGFTPAQGLRFQRAFAAAKVTAVTVLCARYGVSAAGLISAMRCSKNAAAEMEHLVARIETAPAFIRYVHSGIDF